MADDQVQAVVDMPEAETALKKADVGKRFIAAVIDGALAAVVGLIPVVGGIIGALYILLRDGLDYEYMRRRSVGKTLMKLKPVTLDGSEMDIATSLRRNWMFAIGIISLPLLIIPILGWIVAVLLWIAAPIIAIVEIVLVLNSSDGRRWGDKLANTMVIESND